MTISSGITAPPSFEDVEQYRRELTGYCYRMLGSGFEAEDAVQETIVRAWKNGESFEGRSALRSWLYRIATNVCLDMLRSKQRRARPMELGPSSTAANAVLATLPAEAWVTPVRDGAVLGGGGDGRDSMDPADVVAAKESIKLAFVAALQHLPARQRAVLILREVLKWQASEVAELLETSVASVNSALQRARATLGERIGDAEAGVPSAEPMDDSQKDLLAKYVSAFERYDVDELVTLLHDDVVLSMPPYDLWLRGIDDFRAWFLGPGIECKGSRLVATAANGCAAFGSYRIDPAGGHAPWALQVVEIAGGRIVGHHNFLDTSLFEAFGLPAHLDP